MAKRLLAFAVLAGALALGGCDDPVETGRSIVTVKQFNFGSPVQSDVLFDDGTSAYVPEDLIPCTFTSRPYNQYVTGFTRDAVMIKRYHISWVRIDGGSGALAARDEACAIYVTHAEDADAAIRLVTWEDKSGPILSPLIGSANQIRMQATITFFGTEVGSTDEIEFGITVDVNFADTVNS
jgi:hypothetical protein